MKGDMKMKTKNKIKAAICFVLFLTVFQVNAARYITVATIGGKPGEISNKQDMQRVVEDVIQFWQARITQVLPDKPDLIVLPEGCDYPQGLSGEGKKEYRRIRKNQVRDFFASIAKANH
jgi:hypothetical protein